MDTQENRKQADGGRQQDSRPGDPAWVLRYCGDNALITSHRALSTQILELCAERNRVTAEMARRATERLSQQASGKAGQQDSSQRGAERPLSGGCLLGMLAYALACLWLSSGMASLDVEAQARQLLNDSGSAAWDFSASSSAAPPTLWEGARFKVQGSREDQMEQAVSSQQSAVSEEEGTQAGIPPEGGTATVVPPWRQFIYDCAPVDAGYARDQLVRLVDEASALSGVAPAAIVATLLKESGLRHLDDKGRVVRGDGGRALGMGQIHYRLWDKHFSFNAEFGEQRQVRVSDLRDNVLCCALLLKRGGWQADDADSQARAYGYYNTGHEQINGYAKSVARYAEAIAAYQPSAEGTQAGAPVPPGKPEHPDNKSHPEDGDG